MATQFFLIFTLFWGRFPFWLIFFRWVGSTTKQHWIREIYLKIVISVGFCSNFALLDIFKVWPKFTWSFQRGVSNSFFFPIKLGYLELDKSSNKSPNTSWSSRGFTAKVIITSLNFIWVVATGKQLNPGSKDAANNSSFTWSWCYFFLFGSGNKWYIGIEYLNNHSDSWQFLYTTWSDYIRVL